jgi:hypothetical protein
VLISSIKEKERMSIYVRYIDIDLEIPCEKSQCGLVCPKKAIAEVYTDNGSRYLCRSHLIEIEQAKERYCRLINEAEVI